ncbi:PQQ-dependent sugar dehydrogenase [Qipengyuania citrea]|uniref:PQQ-dependent sugar dehydrogenase n=1 Tax=Qipengyuania citrea TaxID=225971 RepID=A0ABY4UAU1_9SPHN|nr:MULTISPECIES: PQQ-dependent sugar dehydrogenase [Erythrobacteraceae]MAQ66642.1 dehydrogenase [Sphingomonadaceae bacterium]MBG76036.1 dehydrogenase [Erythrobacteraceae bacterium]MBL4895706.1 PQQ-dependent sugar dehydrogenase [Erythrobacter sp.]MBV01451.1 dehydrogenase [Citromicrobium sp.]MEC7953660.1 PQQ-dependent sugar dehydrogenase [Pseudomonadota bacterium]|tara:strand:+ start:194 stop:1381 length:1188 start_codon:yes stop_codon:yes gene_type:complete
MRQFVLAATLSPMALLASCGNAASGDSAQTQSTPMPSETISVSSGQDLNAQDYGTFDEPWAAEFAPGTDTLFITERGGTIKFVDTANGTQGTVTGAPEVDYGGQGGLGDIAFLPSESSSSLDRRTIYLSWAEAGEGDTRGAVVGRGTLECAQTNACAIEGLEVIWRQAPKVTGRGHYSHRLAFSPDERYLFVASGDRQKMQPAQDTSNNLGSIVRLNLDGSTAAGNPLAGEGGISAQLWSWGHRNILGLQFDGQGRLWDLEHGPAGGDELNLVQSGGNYGWPEVSGGDHYDGKPIPRNSTRDDFIKPAVNWTPVIAPGDFIFYSGDQFAGWKGAAVIAAMKPSALVVVTIDGESARETQRIPFEKRLREIVQGPDGAIWVLEDKEGGRLLKLTPG